MYKKLRIVCTIISALFLAVILPAATFFGLNGLVICGFGAGLFFFLTLLFRKAQQNQDEKNGTTQKLDESEDAVNNFAENEENSKNTHSEE